MNIHIGKLRLACGIKAMVLLLCWLMVVMMNAEYWLACEKFCG
jgi:hypothetical protein